MAIVLADVGTHYNLMDVGEVDDTIAIPPSASMWTDEDWSAAHGGDEAAFIAGLETELGKPIVDTREDIAEA
jgi:hypothetical protein